MDSMSSLTVSETRSLTDLPSDIFYIVISYLDTAKSVSNLALTCKGLYHLVIERGWRIFVTTRFNTFSFSEPSSENEWKELARSLTSQSRDWDRRAFVLAVHRHPQKAPKQRAQSGFQSIPGNILVDASRQRIGNDAQDIVFWGAGEHAYGLIRHTRGSKAPTDEWLGNIGSTAKRPGIEDITCISILKDDKYKYGTDEPQVLVGRANGKLELLSMGAREFGKGLLNFRRRGSKSHNIKLQIQSLDVNYQQGLLAAASKQDILIYPLIGNERHGPHATHKDDGEWPNNRVNETWAHETVALKELSKDRWPFDFIRSVKFVNENTLAVGLNRCRHPLQYLRPTPTGLRRSAAATIGYQGKAGTVRAILPVDTSSVASGSGNAVLSSWDDGTIRLQDLRTASPYDSIFQDNFEMTTPINCLLSRGLERFIAGSARTRLLKVFDYRWPKGYYYTEALPCGADNPYPKPYPPTTVAEPSYPDNRTKCDYVGGHRCRWHALSKMNFYRPNFNMYMKNSLSADSPIYSLASPADDSPSLFVGVSGNLIEMTTKGSERPNAQTVRMGLPYKVRRDDLMFIETGSGFPLNDFSLSSRIPPMYKQSVVEDIGDETPERVMWRKRHRFDEGYQ
ncbi:hypothetical protein F4819DRAFT_493840 [Hypoxylon fuscum]|nr:hypothetical protein F4819DRAFT_493840 [Hypoxylon fuscum]